MAQASNQSTSSGAAAKGNTAVPHGGDHDRVAMLSLKADGTPDQHNPEIIGDKEFALEATKEQFKQQAVSAVDVAERGVTSDTGAETVGQDPMIEKLQEAHDKAADAAESAAENVVEALHHGDSTPAEKGTSGSASSSTGSGSSK